MGRGNQEGNLTGLQQAAKARGVGLITAWTWVRAEVIRGHWVSVNGEAHMENVGCRRREGPPKIVVVIYK